MCCDQGCHFWADFNCPLELNCTVNYHIIAFSAVIYVHIRASALQLVGRGISAAGLTPNTAGCFSTSKHQSPPALPLSALFFLHSFVLSFSSCQTRFHSFSLCLFLPVSLQAMLSLAPLYCPSSIWAVFEGMTVKYPQGYTVALPPLQRTHTQAHTYTCEHLHLLFSVIVVFFPIRRIDTFSLHLFVWVVILPTILNHICQYCEYVSLYVQFNFQKLDFPTTKQEADW